MGDLHSYSRDAGASAYGMLLFNFKYAIPYYCCNVEASHATPSDHQNNSLSIS